MSTTNVAHLSPRTQEAVDIEKTRLQNLPTTRLNAMIAESHAAIAALDENEEHLRAGLKVLIDRQNETRASQEAAIAEEVADLRKRIDALTESRRVLHQSADASIAKAEADVDAQIEAIEKMRNAQRAVVASLSIDATSPSVPKARRK